MPSDASRDALRYFISRHLRCAYATPALYHADARELRRPAQPRAKERRVDERASARGCSARAACMRAAAMRLMPPSMRDDVFMRDARQVRSGCRCAAAPRCRRAFCLMLDLRHTRREAPQRKMPMLCAYWRCCRHASVCMMRPLMRAAQPHMFAAMHVTRLPRRRRCQRQRRVTRDAAARNSGVRTRKSCAHDMLRCCAMRDAARGTEAMPR